jgi:hypothetical protein
VVVHRFPRVAAIVLLEYLAAATIFFALLKWYAAVNLSPRQCGVDKCAVLDLIVLEAFLLFAGWTVTGFVVSLIVIAFRQWRWARTGNPASHETGVFGAATVATAFGWAWVLPASPLILWAANGVFDFLNH